MQRTSQAPEVAVTHSATALLLAAFQTPTRLRVAGILRAPDDVGDRHRKPYPVPALPDVHAGSNFSVHHLRNKTTANISVRPNGMPPGNRALDKNHARASGAGRLASIMR